MTEAPASRLIMTSMEGGMDIEELEPRATLTPSFASISIPVLGLQAYQMTYHRQRDGHAARALARLSARS